MDTSPATGPDTPNPARSSATQRCERAKNGRFSSHDCQLAPSPWMKTIAGPDPRSTYSSSDPSTSTRPRAASQSTSSHAERTPLAYGGMPQRIAIDIDSTLHDYWRQFREVAQRRTGVDLPYEEQTDWL